MHMQRTNIHVYHLSSRSSETRLSCPVKHSAYITGSLFLWEIRSASSSCFTKKEATQLAASHPLWLLRML